MNKYTRFIPLILILITVIVALRFDIFTYLNFATLKQYHVQLTSYVTNDYWLAVSVFCILYIILVITSLPLASLLTLVGGFMFGSLLGTVYVVVSATIGAILLVIAVKLAFGPQLIAKISRKVKFMEASLEHNAFFYLLSLRLLPIVPFWLVNLAAGVLNIKLRDFIITTFIGIIPGTFVYVNIGSSLTTIFATTSNEFNLKALVDPQILIALTLLGIISLIPAVVKSIKQRKYNA